MSTLTFVHVHLGKMNAVEIHVHLGKFNAVDIQDSRKSLVLCCQFDKIVALVPFPLRNKIFQFTSAFNGLVVSGHLH